jgi:hypothetical protein
MKRNGFLGSIAITSLFVLAAGCASSGKAPAPTYGGRASVEAQAYRGPGDAPAPAAPPAPAMEESADAEYAPPAPAAKSAGGMAMRRESRPRPRHPRHRPGLGTTWGETRRSEVRHRRFDRASSDPFARLAVYYNDAEGISAQMAYRGGEGPSPYYARTPNGNITVALESPDGRVLVGRRANGRTYVVGREGERYNIVIRNNTGGRFEVVASVDGLDVIDGRPATTGKRGYLLPPHGKLVIDGFRKSDSTVAAFRFGKVSDSYAARTTGGRNVGVIGVAFFGERGTEWTTDEIRRRETADPFPVDTRYAQPPPSGRVY